MTTKKKTAVPSPIQQLIAYAAPKDNKCILSLPISETENINIEIKRLLDTGEMVSFVDDITDTLFLNNRYTPALYKLVYAKAILAYYTNLDSSISNEDVVHLIFDSNIISEIEAKVNITQRQEIASAIVKNIEYRQRENFSTQATLLNRNLQQLEICTDVLMKFSEQTENLDMKAVSDAVVNLASKKDSEIVKAVLDFNDMKDK